jgi:hypothetical protein
MVRDKPDSIGERATDAPLQSNAIAAVNHAYGSLLFMRRAAAQSEPWPQVSRQSSRLIP